MEYRKDDKMYEYNNDIIDILENDKDVDLELFNNVKDKIISNE